MADRGPRALRAPASKLAERQLYAWQAAADRCAFVIVSSFGGPADADGQWERGA
eukprot:CAMPEP_0195102736 /NCGR_PEP_ID=MMETSP0448-20130528/69193_1 /TAXON_ID=66468 /ORGANISM="Heterocapsa triquestra, Strain CCMP 448" /LENGTH=53 /DNA_ID=CAMNT_0040138283 /DNA_START=11 /DNA_END=170 /DNA_ORIENTATION=-